MAPTTLPPRTKTSAVDELFDRARQAHEAVQAEPGASLERAFEAGEALIAAKAQVPRGEWGERLAKAGIPASSARLYMQLARAKDYIIASGATSIRQARQLLIDTRPKPKARRARVRPDDTDQEVQNADRYKEGYADGYQRGYEGGYQRGKADGWSAAMKVDGAAKANHKGAPAPTDADLLWLIGLAHPDRHMGDDKVVNKATRITQWLNDLRA